MGRTVKWTDEEEATLRACHAAGMTPRETSVRIPTRGWIAISQRGTKLGLKWGHAHEHLRKYAGFNKAPPLPAELARRIRLATERGICERDEAITVLVIDLGYSRGVVAKAYGVTRTRIGQIVARESVRRDDDVYDLRLERLGERYSDFMQAAA